MTNLISTLEAADEGSRELDALIWETLDEMQQWQTRSPGLYYNDGKTDDQYEPGHYTTSLDDALTLVPEGWLLARLGKYHLFLKYDPDESVNWDDPSSWEFVWGCEIGRQEGWVGYDDDVVRHIEVLEIATPALALCIAALKAKDSEK